MHLEDMYQGKVYDMQSFETSDLVWAQNNIL